MKRGNKYEITFIDVSGFNGWSENSDVDEALNNLATVRLVGYFVKQTKDVLILAQGVGENKDYSPWLRLEIIPRGSITTIKEI